MSAPASPAKPSSGETAIPEEIAIPEDAVAIPPVAAAGAVSDKDFEDIVRGTLDSVGGVLLFKMRVGDDGQSQHVAAAAIGNGAGQQFFVLTLPTAGGQLRVETAAKSANPLAGIAASYAGLADAFAAAA